MPDDLSGVQIAGDLALRVSSRLPRYSDRYSVVVSDQAKHKPELSNLWKSVNRSALAFLGFSLHQPRLVLCRHGIEFRDGRCVTGIRIEGVSQAV